MSSPSLYVNAQSSQPMFSRSEASDAHTIALMYEAIEALPAAVTKDYKEALASAPELVMTETHPSKFLRCENDNPWSAALRWVQNWTFRRDIFGESHWLRPMRLRDGALRPEDIALLRRGVFILLTPPEPNARQVMVNNYGLLNGEDPGMSRQRIAQYLCCTTLNEYTQRHGLDVLAVIDGTGMKVRPDNGRLLQVTNYSTSFTIHRIILANDPNETRKTLRHLFGVMIRRLAENFWAGKGQLVNVGAPTPSETMSILRSYGLHPSTVPTQLGGEFSYKVHIDEWLTRRLLQESNLNNARRVSPSHMTNALSRDCSVGQPISLCATYNDDGSLDYSSSSSLQKLSSRARTISSPSELLTSTEYNPMPARQPPQDANDHTAITRDQPKGRRGKPREVIRKRKCEYSKRHYYKKKNQRKLIQEECDALRQHQTVLQIEHEFLTKLWAQAQWVLQTHSVARES